eukprot:m.19632 g.19632  ORF g.19632 m.19632 type:complete len:69 (+) comp31214_c0_seq1:58-264(+)
MIKGLFVALGVVCVEELCQVTAMLIFTDFRTCLSLYFSAFLLVSFASHALSCYRVRVFRCTALLPFLP